MGGAGAVGDDQPLVLAVANQKGGVGKTTTALSLAGAMAAVGRRVLVMDLDPHACASIHLSFYQEDLEATIRDLFLGQDPVSAWDRVIRTVDQAGFDMVPGHIRLAEIDLDLSSVPNRGLILKDRLALLGDRYDTVILDCPPGMGVLLVNALLAASLVLIPIQTDFLSLHGVKLIFKTITTLNRVGVRPISFRGLATMHDRRAGACKRALEFMREQLGERMCKTVIHVDTKLRDASAAGRVIQDLAPGSRAAVEYRALARELLGHDEP